MPTLIIDDIPVSVPEGTTVLEAARAAGIVIPHFCWHPALGRAGACRVCAVKLLDGPVKGIQMSCMLPAQEGMVVATTDDEAVAMRRAVIEWLMINHPHDCPVCDEGGECQLQDFTIAGGHGIRRYDGRKRTHVNQYLGELVEHEMNRCIQCYRCARYYQEYAGGTDFGVTGRAAGVYFGRRHDGPLESPFSGNLVDICPTGVFTDKTARFRARYWDYDMAPSVCPHCSLGCSTTPMARYRELLKVTARQNDAVNGWFICDRGRFSNAAVNAPDRPRQPTVDGVQADTAAALDALVERLNEFLELHGPERLAIVGSPRMSHEGNIMAARLRETLGAGTLSYCADEVSGTAAAAAACDGSHASQEDVRTADLVVILGCDLLAEAPMLALAVRQAWRNGAAVYLADSPLLPREEVRGAEKRLPFPFTRVASLAEVPFEDAVHPVVVGGMAETALAALRGVPVPGVKISRVLGGANSFGCALLAAEHNAVPFSRAMAEGRVRGVIAFEADLPDLPEEIRVLGAVDWRPTPLMGRSEVAIPACAWVEQDGTYINQEGRAQRFRKIMDPGLPIKGLDPARHPPRVHRRTPPGSDAAPAWHIIATLLELLGEHPVAGPLTGRWAVLAEIDAEGPGALVNEQPVNDSFKGDLDA